MRKKKTQYAVRAAVALSCACMMFAFVACESGGGTKTPKEVTAEVWTAYGTEKILRDPDYSARYGAKTLTINAFRNEKEAAQIVISPDGDAEYTFELADLINENGTVLPKESFTVYHQKYINLETIKDTVNAQGAGYYPDALLPYEKAVEYDENKITGGQNQGLWISLKADKEQESGVYTGNFKATVAGKEYSVPVAVTLYDYTLSDKVQMKTRFSFSPTEIGISEMNYTDEIYQTYYETMLDYRITGSGLPLSYSLYQQDQYFDLVEKYTKDERVTIIPLIFTGGATVVEHTADGLIAVDEAIGKEGTVELSIPTVYWSTFENTLLRFAKESFARGSNLAEKLSFYASLIDEYDASPGNAGLNKAVYNIRRIEDSAVHTAKIVENMRWMEVEDAENGGTKRVICQNKTLKFDDLTDNAGYGYSLVDLEEPIYYDCDLTETAFKALQAEVAADLGALRNVTTATKVNDFFYEYANASFCPTIDYYESEGNRIRAKNYAEKANSEVWVYTAVNPCSPWPTYHTEDVLITSRLLGWMMYEYDIVGNLYWATTLSRKTDGLDPQVQDLYEDPIRFPMNGDGYMFYPGRTYGMEEPVTSLRLHSICDSVEDYDLLYALEQYSLARGATGDDFNTMLDFLIDGLYSGTRCTIDDVYLERFAASRDLLGQMLALTSNTGATFEKYELINDTATFTVSAPTGVTLKQDGEALTAISTESGIDTYKVEVKLDKESNTLNFTATADGKTYALNLALGGRSAMMDSAAAYYNVPTNKTTENAVVAETLDGESVVKVIVETVEGMQARFNASSLDFDVDETYKKMVFRVYNYGDQMNVTVRGRAEKSKASVAIITQTLLTGWNEIEVDLSAVRLATNGKLDWLGFVLEAEDGKTIDAATVSIAFGKITMVG